tara:strand:+ start:158 stop:313 length:156 start_codon:yes stop_codon:yes gene_type:complete
MAILKQIRKRRRQANGVERQVFKGGNLAIPLHISKECGAIDLSNTRDENLF